jgi:hypothetical protein
VFTGIVALIVPGLTDDIDPMLSGFVNEPVALLNCAVNTLPVLKVPVFVNGTLMVDPAQNGEPEIGLVVMVCENNLNDPVIKKRKKNVRFIVVFLMKIN